jgi:archaellum component FlaC
MNIEAIEALEKLDIEIEVVKAKIKDMQMELKELKNKRNVIAKPIELARKIKRYEEMYPDSLEKNLDSLVKVNETFDEWYERFGRHTNGGKNDKLWARGYYLKLGYTDNNYIKWLVESDDPRVIDTEIYKLKR